MRRAWNVSGILSAGEAAEGTGYRRGDRASAAAISARDTGSFSRDAEKGSGRSLSIWEDESSFLINVYPPWFCLVSYCVICSEIWKNIVRDCMELTIIIKKKTI